MTVRGAVFSCLRTVFDTKKNIGGGSHKALPQTAHVQKLPAFCKKKLKYFHVRARAGARKFRRSLKLCVPAAGPIVYNVDLNACLA